MQVKKMIAVDEVKKARKKKRTKTASLCGEDVIEKIRTLRSDYVNKAETSDDKEGFVVLAGKKLPVTRVSVVDEKERESDFVTILRVLKNIVFKPDHPYRTKVALHNLIATNASGVLTTSYANASISSAAEWSSVAALFDEFFIHSVEFTYKSFNEGGQGLEATAQPSQGTYVTAAAVNYVLSAGLIGVSLFTTASAYTTAQSMSNNPTRKLLHSGKDWSYVWRNNVSFDGRGPALDPLTSIGWSGWTLIGAVANIGGAVQFRTLGDQVIGDGAHAVNLGYIEIRYDVSFRARA